MPTAPEGLMSVVFAASPKRCPDTNLDFSACDGLGAMACCDPLAAESRPRVAYWTLVLQVGVDPLFEFAAAFVGGVEADAEGVLGLFPGYGAADPDARQSEQCEGDFDGLAGAPCPPAILMDMPPELTSRLVAVIFRRSPIWTATSVMTGMRM